MLVTYDMEFLYIVATLHQSITAHCTLELFNTVAYINFVCTYIEEKIAEILEDDADDAKHAAVTHVTEQTIPKKESTAKFSWRNRLVVLLLVLLFTGLACIVSGVLKQQEVTKLARRLLPKRNGNFKTWITANQSNQLLTHDNQTLPVIIALQNFTNKKKSKEEWYSNPFFTFTGGHRMCTSIYANGMNNGKNTHLSVLMHLMKGPYDDNLQKSGHWPLRGIFTIELLNQLHDENHYTRNLTFNSTTPKRYARRVQDSDRPSIGWGEVYFISQNAILRNKSNYLVDNNLYFRIHFEPESHENNYGFNAKGLLLSSLICVGEGLGVLVVVAYLERRQVKHITITAVVILLITLAGFVVMRHFLGGLLWGAITIFVALCCRLVSKKVKKHKGVQMVCLVLALPLGNVIAQFIIVDTLRMPWGILWWLI